MKSLIKDRRGGGYSGIIVGCAIAVIILVIILPSEPAEFGTLQENTKLLQTVQDLQAQGYQIDNQHTSIFDKGRTNVQYTVLYKFLGAIHDHNLTDLHYTTTGTLGPKIWTIDNNGDLIYWRAD